MLENLANKTNFVYGFTLRYYDSIVRSEIKLGQINKSDNVLCIGGGNCPFTAILFNRLTGAKITVIDSNADCVRNATVFVQKHGFGEQIRILHLDGKVLSDTDLQQFAIIHIALQVSPMEAVFMQIMRNAKSETKVLVRKSHKRHKYLGNCRGEVVYKRRNVKKTELYVV